MERPNHINLNEDEGVVRVPAFKPKESLRKSWAILPSKGEKVRLTFDHYGMERVFDTIKIYEMVEKNNLGPIKAVLHGESSKEQTFEFDTGVYIVFSTSKQTIGGKGFQFKFEKYQK